MASLQSRFHAAENEDDLSSGMCLTAELAAELAAELHADEAPLPADLAATLHERKELLEPAGSGVDGCSFFVLTGPQGKVGGLSDLVEPGHTLDGQSIESTHLDGLKWQPGLQQQVSGARSVRWHARSLQGSQTDDETLERAPLSEEDAAQLAAAALQHFKVGNSTAWRMQAGGAPHANASPVSGCRRPAARNHQRYAPCRTPLGSSTQTLLCSFFSTAAESTWACWRMTGKISSVMSEGEPACTCAVQRGRMLG